MSMPRWINVSDSVSVLIGAGAGARIEQWCGAWIWHELGPGRVRGGPAWERVGFGNRTPTRDVARVAAEQRLYEIGTLTAHDLAKLVRLESER